MGFLDNISKSIQQGVDRAKFEAEKFQKTTKYQGEVNEFKRQLDAKLMELGQRAYDLQRAGQINAPSIAQLSATVDQLRATLLAKEEELNQAQAENFPEPPTASPPPTAAQQVPISYEAPTIITPPPQAGPTQKTCPNCGFQMPGTAMFCPNCGTRVAG
jgi:DNA repair exonuclease SbcCD ATPase subunit